jgi:hypothetical protein
VFVYQYGRFIQYETVDGDFGCGCETNESTERVSKYNWSSADSVNERSEVSCFAAKDIIVTVTAVTSSSPIRDVQAKFVDKIRPESVPRPSCPRSAVEENQRLVVPFTLVCYTRSIRRPDSVNCRIGGLRFRGPSLFNTSKFSFLKMLLQCLPNLAGTCAGSLSNRFSNSYEMVSLLKCIYADRYGLLHTEDGPATSPQAHSLLFGQESQCETSALVSVSLNRLHS